jgi:hypothetical protein
MKKIKKLHRKIEKKVKKFLHRDPNEGRLVNILYVLVIMFALSYGGLVYLAAKIINRESRSQVIVITPTPFERRMGNTVAGYPMEKMTPYLARKNKKVATFLLAIAKKESNWGKFSPKKDGRECWNFWGYRGDYNVTNSGYSCFDSPKQAVDQVGARVQDLINKNIDTPQEMSVWKCGYDCSWDNPKNVNKWVADVGYYYKKIYE